MYSSTSEQAYLYSVRVILVWETGKTLYSDDSQFHSEINYFRISKTSSIFQIF